GTRRAPQRPPQARRRLREPVDKFVRHIEWSIHHLSLTQQDRISRSFLFGHLPSGASLSCAPSACQLPSGAMASAVKSIPGCRNGHFLSSGTGANNCPLPYPVNVDGKALDLVVQDRKSTRLNSSHVEISY